MIEFLQINKKMFIIGRQMQKLTNFNSGQKTEKNIKNFTKCDKKRPSTNFTKKL